MPVQSTAPNLNAAFRPRTNFRKILYIVIVVAVSFSLIIVAFCCLLLSKPVTYPLPAVDIMAVNMGILHRVLPELSMQPPVERATLILTPQEVNHLLNTLRIVHAGWEHKFTGPPANSYNLHFCDGVLAVDHSIPRDGMTMRIHAELVPEFRDGRIHADMKICKIGSLRLPAWFVSNRIRWANVLLQELPEFRLLQKFLISLRVLPDGNVEIVYNPAGIMTELTPQILPGKPPSETLSIL